MGFTTGSFLFLFLPVTLCLLLLYTALTRGSANASGKWLLFLSGLVFYAWSSLRYAGILLAYALAIYVFALLLQKQTNDRTDGSHQTNQLRADKKWLLAVPVSLTVLFLAFAKYCPWLLELINADGAEGKRILSLVALPGLSFITFSAISYLVDIGRGEAVAGSFLDCLCYFFFFPKLISGPIVTWHDFQPQLVQRRVTARDLTAGFNRLAIGMAKKLILADTFGNYALDIQAGGGDVPAAWLVWLLYGMQIYYDFSGYSDMAIGLGRMFGFQITENFNFPYRSLSLTEFWRRWHISLGSFFRNYVYIPLGGNRKGKGRTLLHLFLVFLLTGIWHGAGPAYLLWGVLHGVMVCAERLARDCRWYRRIPGIFKWMFTFFFVFSSWQLFRCGDVSMAWESLCSLFGARAGESAGMSIYYYLDNQLLIIGAIGIVGMLLPGNSRVLRLYERLREQPAFALLQELVLLLLFLLAVIFMVDSTYRPFIYFQF